MSLVVLGADTVYPCIGLFTTQALPRKDQGVGGAMFQTVSSIARAMFLPVTAALQSSVQTRHIRNGMDEHEALLEGYRAVEWFSFGCIAASLGITIVGLRNMGKIGLQKKLGNVQSATKEKDRKG